MTYNDKYGYWLMISDYDYETAQEMIKARRWMYVALICYSSVERLVKGLTILHTHKEAPKSDNLLFLINRLAASQTFTETPEGKRFVEEKEKYMDGVADITYYHVSDYPFSYQKVADRFIGENTAKEVFNKAGDILLWLKTFAPEEVES